MGLVLYRSYRDTFLSISGSSILAFLFAFSWRDEKIRILYMLLQGLQCNFFLCLLFKFSLEAYWFEFNRNISLDFGPSSFLMFTFAVFLFSCILPRGPLFKLVCRESLVLLSRIYHWGGPTALLCNGLYIGAKLIRIYFSQI